MTRQKQQPFAELVSELFREQRKHPHLTVTLLRRHWPGIVGAELAGRTHPQRIERDVLWVAAVDSSWAYQLQFMQEELLASVTAFLETQAVQALRFEVGEIPPPPPAPAPVPREVPPDPTVERLARAIPDEALRRQFERTFSKQAAGKARQAQPAEPPGPTPRR